jgi:hypothetical protein
MKWRTCLTRSGHMITYCQNSCTQSNLTVVCKKILFLKSKSLILNQLPPIVSKAELLAVPHMLVISGTNLVNSVEKKYHYIWNESYSQWEKLLSIYMGIIHKGFKSESCILSFVRIHIPAFNKTWPLHFLSEFTITLCNLSSLSKLY